MSKRAIREYCTGCGLCQSVCRTKLEKDDNDFLSPVITEDNISFLEKVCPAAGKPSNKLDKSAIWGKNEVVLLGWSSDSKIREQASSGGVLSALCCMLLSEGIVDGIIQTKAVDVYRTETVVSTREEEVLECMGSRYSVSSPLCNIKQLVVPGKHYAFVGKPCDVASLRTYLDENEELNEQIRYLFAFFCAGIPSASAQRKLLSTLKCEKDECQSLQYRGNGWPGYATAVSKKGEVSRITYNESWGNILGRDVKKACRVCFDGIGELADIACGDAWYIDNEGKPDFSEHEGRNVIFARTQSGHELIQRAKELKVVETEQYADYEKELPIIQKYQYERRAAMRAMLFALRICGKSAPHYNREQLKAYSRKLSFKKKFKRFTGTVKRNLKGKM
ncbi:MAG: Coenzyme F420 hydrogenase/dehydrogenase, beta subunit C-terminal domain [Lachnospiraceae bacterium]